MEKPAKNMVKEELDPRLIATVLIVGIIEFEVFIVPRTIVQVTGQDAWISVLLGGGITLLTTWMLITLAARFPRENFFQYHKRVWGKVLSWPITLGYFLFWIVFLVMLLQEFSWINKTFFLYETPVFIPKLLIILAAALLVSYGFAVLARFFQLMLPFLLIPLLSVFLLTIFKIEWVHFLPILEKGMIPVLKGTAYYLGSIQGLMGIILFFSPFMKEPRSVLKPALVAVSIVFLLNIVQTIGAIGVLGVENIKESAYPGIDTITVIEMPGFPVERYELWLTMPWLLGIFTTWSLFLYLLAYEVMQVLGINAKKTVIYSWAAILFIITYLIPNSAWTTQIRRGITLATLGFVYLIPAFTFIVAIIRKKRGTGV
ncbi:MAG: GerAB/ArcD/ProY family transporter [Peptococcaceae bacterium]